MIDTIRIYKQITTDLNQINIFKEELTSSVLKLKSNDEFETSGYYKNMHLKISQSRIVITGSLNVLAKGDNVKSISLKDIHDSLFEIGEFLKLDIWSFTVTRVDISINVITKISIDSIKQCLEIPKYMKMTPFQNGISYGNSNRQILFYDKHKEAKLKKTFIPQTLKIANLIRIELRLLKASTINNLFGVKETSTHEMLSNYIKLQNYFQECLNELKWSKSTMNQNNIFHEDLNLIELLLTLGYGKLGGLENGYALLESAKPLYKETYPNKYTNDRKLLERLNKKTISNKFTQSINDFENMYNLAFDYDRIIQDFEFSK